MVEDDGEVDVKQGRTTDQPAMQGCFLSDVLTGVGSVLYLWT